MGSPSYEVVNEVQPVSTFEGLLGKTLSNVEVTDDKYAVILTTTDGFQYKLEHNQDCCEQVTVEDVCGDLSDLIGSPLTLSEESTNSDENPEDLKAKYGTGYQESFTWTFYRLATVKGAVTIRFYGTSNGYYGEGVDFSFVGVGENATAQNG